VSGTVLRLVVAVVCFVGIVLGGALAPAIGVETPVPDLGVENGEGGSIGEELLVDGGSAPGPSTASGRPAAGAESGPERGSDGGSGPAGAGGSAGAGGEFVESVETTEGGVPVESGTRTYGGVSSGGYPQESSVGGPLSLSDQVELRVESPEPSRWRLGAYANYTGSGWDRRTTPSERLSGLLPTVDGTSTPAYEIRVTPQRSFDSLATAWRPAYAAAPNRDVSVTEERGLVVSEPVTAGDTYVTATYGAPSHAAAAAASGGGSVPSEIRDRYTGLPDDTPARLGDRTAEITADAETPYETAAAVQLWLTENKEYSLDAGHERGNDVATEFVFEMDAGYCEYFATSMVAMLRTQDVPARYVTGYGPGEAVGDDEYVVRGQDAHAWVEVYITDVGWVTFDPTPASGRVDADRDAAPVDGGGPTSGVQTAGPGGQSSGPGEPGPDGESGRDGSDDGEPSDGETDGSGDSSEGSDSGQGSGSDGSEGGSQNDSSEEDSSEEDGQDGSSEEDGQDDGSENSGSEDDGSEDSDSENGSESAETAPLEIELSADPVPGRDLTVTVTRDGEPVSGATVSFNGDPVGETNAAGNVTGEVPYAESLEVVARAEGAETQASSLGPGAVLPGANGGPGATETASGDSLRRFAGGDGIAAVGAADGAAAQTGGNVTVDVPVNVSVETVGEPVAGEPVDVIATVAGEPVSNGTVRVNGTAVGRTGSDGQATVTLPEAETAVINVSRGDATGSRTLSVGRFSVSVTPSTVVLLPLTESVVTVRFDGEPVSDASVAVDSESAGATGANGTAAVRLPFADSASVGATASIGGTSASATTTVGGLYRNLAGAVGLVTFALGSVAVAARRRGISPQSLPGSAARLVVRLVRLGVAGLVRFAAGVEATIAALRRSLSTAVALLTQGLGGVKRLVSAVPAAVRRLFGRLVAALRAAPRYLHPLAILAALKRAGRAGRDAVAGGGNGESTRADPGDEPEADEALLTIRDAWGEFRTHVSIRSWRTATPGEIARWAIHRDGLPQEAVQTLTDAFRDVEYGSRSPSDHAPAARRALEAIRGATDADEEEEAE
jgi:transglutaminase-like putative cysteine protease